MLQAFGLGARGFLVGELQAGLQRGTGQRLGDGIDNKYGTDTANLVIQFARTQPESAQAELRRQLAYNGQAGPAVWTGLGLEWPEIFARCLQLTAGFEGTGFSGSCGPQQTGDTAGVTYGLIGFTSYNGELQELLETVRSWQPQLFEDIGKRTLNGEYKHMLGWVVDENPRSFEGWALTSSGSVRPQVQRWLKELGAAEAMKRQQMEWAHKRYFKRAADQVAQLFNPHCSDRAYALMFDIAVQNGGLKALELSDLVTDFSKDRYMTEVQRMHAINTKLIERLRQAKRPAKIIDDVRSRKTTIVMGSGIVHKSEWKLRAFAL